MWRSAVRLTLASAAMASALTTGALTQQRPDRPATPAPAASSAAAIVVGTNIQVSLGRARDPHYELLAGAHLTDPNKLMACSMVYSPRLNRTTSVVYASHDGGRTWKQTLEVEKDGLVGDPVCPFGLGDNAYFLVLSVARGASRMSLYRSTDAGLTWSSTPTELPFIDREGLVVDTTGGKNHGRIYINGTGTVRAIEESRKTAVTVFRSADGGVIFQGPVQRAAVDSQFVIGMGNSIVMSDGTLVTVFGHNKNNATTEGRENRRGYANSWLRAVTSTDGGETLTAGTVVSEWYMDRERSPSSHIPWLAVDPGSATFKDRLYAVWNDARSGRLDVLLAYSTDKGKTWSKPVLVNDDRINEDPQKGPDQIMPLVAVNKDGVVAVAWYDRRDHKDNLGWYLRLAASVDGGETFGPSVRVSTAPNNFGTTESWPVETSVSGGGTTELGGGGGSAATAPRGPVAVSVRVNSFVHSAGHTSGLVADAAGVFHPVWTDNRSGIAQLWTAPVTVQGKPAKNGSPELAALDDLSDRLTLELSNVTFDRATGQGVLQARLENTSKEALKGPLKARVISLRSDVGVPALGGTVNGLTGVGAMWDFTPLLKDGQLAANTKSDPMTIKFRLTDLRPLVQGNRNRFGLIAFDVKLLGNAPPQTNTPR
jgi:hypothetical protein